MVSSISTPFNNVGQKKIRFNIVSHRWKIAPLACVCADLANQDRDAYFDKVHEARSLHRRWKDEAGVDVIDRVAEKIGQTTNMKVHVARGGDREYFAGVLRAVDRGMGVHADYAPYVSCTNA
jgi:hypothetical protein